MELTNFFLSTDISLGIGIFDNACQYIEKFDVNKLGVIYDSNLNNNDYFLKNLDIINKKYPKSVNVINELNSEPTYSYLEKIRNEFDKHQPDIIIAIGGGSTMDLGKGVALLLKNDVPAISLRGFPKNVNDSLPLITIPSLFGSGSEVSYYAVFIDDVEGKKFGINTKTNTPVKTIIDPLLTMSAPISTVISSAMDSLVHCVDSFGSVKGTTFSRMFSVEGFKNTFNALSKNELDDPASRIDLAIGSICGLIALMNSCDGPTNGFAYYFGVKNKIAHGIAGAIFLKEVMNWNYRNGYKEYYKLLEMNSFDSINDINNEFFNKLDDLYKKLNIPTLANFGYKIENAVMLSENSSKDKIDSFSGNPIPFNKESALEVIQNLI